MVLLLDTTKMNRAHKNLLQKVKKVVPPAKFEKFQNFESLFQYLLGSMDDLDIIVLRASSPEELLRFRRIRDIMRGVRVLLVMPDRNPETLFLGHLLHPRYLAYADSDFDDVASVLKKMLQEYRWSN